MIPSLVFLGVRRESGDGRKPSTLDLTFHIQFQDRAALSLQLETIGVELCGLKREHTDIKAKATTKDNPRLFPCSVTFRAVSDNLEDMGMWFVNQLSKRVDEFLSSAEVEVNEGKKSILPTFSMPNIIEATVSCPHCDQPVVNEEKAVAIKKQLDWAEKEKEFKKAAEDHQKKNPVHSEKGFDQDDFFKWFDLWLPEQPKQHHHTLTHMAKLKMTLFRWSARKEMIRELAKVLNEGN